MASYDSVRQVLNRAFNSTGSTYSLKTDSVSLKQRIAYTAGGLTEYVGEAAPGTATSAAGWRIKKLTYSGSSVTQIDYADGNANFDNIWDNRATYTYS